MHFVAALDDSEMRAVLCLFEGVASGAADGYSRIAGKPAATLLHLGCGLGNALANLHNARKARVPMINIIGDHATYHTQYDAQLQSDIETVAKNVSTWIKTTPGFIMVAFVSWYWLIYLWALSPDQHALAMGWSPDQPIGVSKVVRSGDLTTA